MNPHIWITAVLDDIVAYAERNDLRKVALELAPAADRIARELDDAGPVPVCEPACDVIRLPSRHA